MKIEDMLVFSFALMLLGIASWNLTSAYRYMMDTREAIIMITVLFGWFLGFIGVIRIAYQEGKESVKSK